jgi:hypothetical protein
MPTTKGIMGALNLGAGSGDPEPKFIRITSFGMKATQTLETMDTIDGVYDRTAWRVTPLSVEGDIAFPLPANKEGKTTATTPPFEQLLEFAAARQDVLAGNPGGSTANAGDLINSRELLADYDNTVSYKYTGCKCNTFSMSVAAEEAVEFSMNMIGSDRQLQTDFTHIDRLSPERMLTWNDVEVIGERETGALPTSLTNLGSLVFDSSQIRNFSFEINNNVTKFFALDGGVIAKPGNIIAGKREVTGSIEAAWNGFVDTAAVTGSVPATLDNIQQFNRDVTNTTSHNQIKVFISNSGTLATPSGTNSTGIAFAGVVYDIEDISMTNDFFMGTIGWKAMGRNIAGSTLSPSALLPFADSVHPASAGPTTGYRAIRYKNAFTTWI